MRVLAVKPESTFIVMLNTLLFEADTEQSKSQITANRHERSTCCYGHQLAVVVILL